MNRHLPFDRETSAAMARPNVVRNFFAALAGVLLLCGCMAQLVPAYDQTLVDGLDEANAAALTFFAEVETGSSVEEFAEYRGDYAALIGGFDALRQRAATRYVPPLNERLASIRLVKDNCNSRENPTACLNMTEQNLTNILTTLRAMRDRHRTQGLVEDAYIDLRAEYDTSIDRALTIENALKR